jgi:hypothetical protein
VYATAAVPSSSSTPPPPAEQRIILTDDFGRRVQMSADQFSSIVTDAKAGKLDGITLP